jgi:hypothetical protein
MYARHRIDYLHLILFHRVAGDLGLLAHFSGFPSFLFGRIRVTAILALPGG